MDTEFEMIQKDKTAAIIGTIGYITVFIAASLAQSELLTENSKAKEIYREKGELTSAIASLLLLIALIIRGINANEKLNEKQEKLIKGEKVDSIVPNIFISSGYNIGIIGNILRLIGNLLRLNEPKQ